MSDVYPALPYRRPSRKRLSQGDIALAEFHQLRARSSERPGPGEEKHSSDRLPYFGRATDYEIEVALPAGRQEIRHLRVWSGYVMVLHQACEVGFADANDSRLTIAPIVSKPMWPDAPWPFLRQNQVPGYFYLPSVEAEQRGELQLASDWPEAVVCLAGASLSSVSLIKPRREISLSMGLLPHLQDCIVRFFSVRGFADLTALASTRGKRLVEIVETGLTVPGPARLVKLYFGDGHPECDDQDDEMTLAYWGVRPASAS
jgi:hypothetical protein